MANEIQFLLYNMPEEEGKVQVVIKDDTIWCTQKAMAQLFDIDKSGISRHIANIYKDGELSPDTTVAKIATVVNRGIRGEVEELVDFYNLDMIISVGYRVNSTKATRFRQWATKILNEYIRKGFVLDDDRLKQGTTVFGKDYFRELLERVRSIRASERRIWQQITDIYAECSTDYDRNSPTTKEFLCNYRTDGSRNHLYQGRPYQRTHGIDHVEELSQRTNTQIGCINCEELFGRETNPTTGAYSNFLF